MTEVPREVVTEFWARIQARDWDGVAELLAEDVVLDWPNAHLQIKGRDNVVGFNRSYPEGWSIEVLNVVADGSTVASEVRVPHSTIGLFYALSVYEVEAGRIARGREYWVEDDPEVPPPERAHWFEPIGGSSAPPGGAAPDS